MSMMDKTPNQCHNVSAVLILYTSVQQFVLIFLFLKMASLGKAIKLQR